MSKSANIDRESNSTKKSQKRKRSEPTHKCDSPMVTLDHRREARHLAWFFTYAKKDVEIELSEIFDKHDCQYVYQPEVGKDGYEHFQGCVRFKNGKTFSYMQEMLPKAHLEVCKNWEKAKQYCSKVESRAPAGRPVTNVGDLTWNDTHIFYEHPKFKWWNHLYTKLQCQADYREITWYKGDGDDGKTYFIRKYLEFHKDAIMVTGSAKDMQYAIASMATKPKVVFMNLTRSQEGRISYQGMEAIKDGLFFSGKYESSMVLMPNPHVVVMANWMPDFKQMTGNRWFVWELSHEEDGTIIETPVLDEDYIEESRIACYFE